MRNRNYKATKPTYKTNEGDMWLYYGIVASFTFILLGGLIYNMP